MRSSLLLPLAALLLPVLTSSGAYAKERGVIQLHWGFGTPTQFTITGRVLEDEGIRAPAVHRTSADNLIDTIKTFETDEIEDVVVEIQVGGRRLRGTTDDDGNFEIVAKQIDPPLPVGDLKVVARAIVDRGFRIDPSRSTLRVFPDKPILVIISDFDDTTVETGTKDKSQLAKNALLRNAAQIKPVKGAPAAYRDALKAGAAGFIYLSGSPINFHDRIQHFLVLNKLPTGPVLLKNFGSESLFEQSEYKARRLEAVRAALPKARFVLLGDSGEQDPEIYRDFVKRHPGVVHGVIIRRVVGDESGPARFTGIFVVDDWSGTETVLDGVVREAVRGFAPAVVETKDRAAKQSPDDKPPYLPR